jgi:hypothetical protein
VGAGSGGMVEGRKGGEGRWRRRGTEEVASGGENVPCGGGEQAGGSA